MVSAGSKFTGIDQAMVEVVNTIISDQGVGCEVRTCEVVDKFMKLTGGKYNENAVVPADYCYNRVNESMSLDMPTLLVHVGRGKYQCLGLGAEFTGDIKRRPVGEKVDKVVGKCVNGVRFLSA